MKRLLVILAALVIAAAVGISIYRYPAVIVIGFSPWRIDLPFWIGILLFVVFYLAIHFVFECLRFLLKATRSLAHFGRHYRKYRAKAFIRKGLMALIEGNYSVAEKNLEQSAEYSENPWFVYLSAAKAAQALGEEKKAERYLQQVRIFAPGSELAIALLQAQHCLNKKQYEQAIAILLPWNEKRPNHLLVLEGLKEGYEKSENWEALSHLLPRLKRNAVISKENYPIFEEKVWRKRLLSDEEKAFSYSQQSWQEMPHYLHNNPSIALLAAKSLVKEGRNSEAEGILKHAIKHQWDERLVHFYGCLNDPEPEKLLNVAESWIARHAESAILLLTLGRLAMQSQLWGKAQRYLETSASLHATPETYSELAVLAEKLNKVEQSVQYYKKGLLLAAPATGLLPRIYSDSPS